MVQCMRVAIFFLAFLSEAVVVQTRDEVYFVEGFYGAVEIEEQRETRF